MVITPNTTVRLLRSPLEENDLNTLDFASAEVQTLYFRSLPHYDIDETNYTYQRKDNVIRMKGNFDDLINYNYVMYQNESYSDKWFYAFITHMEYVNDGTTYVYIKTDVFQTWQFDLDYKMTFVEREHTNNDTPGNNTLPENLDLGELIVSSADTGLFNLVSGSNPLYAYVQVAFQVTELIGNMQRPIATGSGEDTPIYNGLFSGLYFFSTPSPAEAQKVIAGYAKAGKADAIVSVFMIPNQLSSGISQSVTVKDISFTINWVISNDSALKLKSGNINKPTYIGDAKPGNVYIPRNKKLLTYPYTFLRSTNFSGQEMVYKFEDWENTSSISFDLYGSISQGCSIRLIPTHYKYTANMASTSSYGISAGKLPILAWATDYYTNWLTQNAINIGFSYVSEGVNAGASLLRGDLGGAVSGLSGIAQTMAQVESQKIIPDSANGETNCGDINVGLRYVGFACVTMSIRREYAERIDRYFDRFGYATKNVKVPNVRGRKYWNYVKTIDCYIEGDSIPQEDLIEIKNMFNQGLTIWHDPNNFMNYGLNNDII